MKRKVNVRRVFLCALVSVFVFAGMANAVILTPTIVSESNTNPYSTTSIGNLNDNSGMTPAVNSGDSLVGALTATHAWGGIWESWVSNAAAPDYFATSSPAVVVWDVSGGGDTNVGSVILWQYQNDGGNGINVGNQTRTIELQFNTEADGSASFAGAVTTVQMAPVMGLASDPSVVNAAQGFALSGDSYRYIRMAVTDNHYGDPDGYGVNPTIGGDRVGLGEVRFDTEVVPEPATIALLGAGLLGLIRRRKHS